MKLQTKSFGERPDVKINDNFLRLDLNDIAPMVRYFFSFKFMKPYSKVLDIGCGHGHGVLIQSFYADYVTGVDVSDEVLAVAKHIKEIKNVDNANFVKGLENVKGSFDIITAFEIIEHVEIPTGVEIIHRAKNLLSTKGIFFISTPYIDFRGKTYWPHHKHEYYSFELIKILKNHFKYVKTYYHLADGFYLQTGFLRSLFFNPLGSASSLIFVCSPEKIEISDYNQGKHIFYLFFRGLYRNVKYLVLRK